MNFYMLKNSDEKTHTSTAPMTAEAMRPPFAPSPKDPIPPNSCGEKKTTALIPVAIWKSGMAMASTS